MKTTIEHITPIHPQFYAWIGPFAMNPEVIKEYMGYPLVTGPDWNWFVAFENGVVAGFCAYYKKGDKLVFENTYVIAERRNNGLYKELFEARMEYVKKHETFALITCVATHLSTPYLLKMGFEIKKAFVNWNNMIYTPKPTADESV